MKKINKIILKKIIKKKLCKKNIQIMKNNSVKVIKATLN